MSTTYGPHPGMEACGNGHSGSGSRGRSYRMGYGEAMPMMGGWKLDANDFVPSNNPRMPASIQQVNMEHDVANGQGWNREMKDFDTQGPTSTSQTHQTSSPPSMPNGSSSGGSTTTLLPSHSNDHSMYSMYSNSNSVDNYLDDPYSRSSRHYPTHTYTQRPHRHSSYPSSSSTPPLQQDAPDSQEDSNVNSTSSAQKSLTSVHQETLTLSFFPLKTVKSWTSVPV
ncbi:hypothetical protein BC829DRAFT_114138 [Chytridium lagenaria]|nr:hypothetical protein BC829DRAFT_114138 [Chytridium lagenaria]